MTAEMVSSYVLFLTILIKVHGNVSNQVLETSDNGGLVFYNKHFIHLQLENGEHETIDQGCQ